MKTNELDPIANKLISSYNEISLFLMSIAFILNFMFDANFRLFIYNNIEFKYIHFRSIIVIICFIGGLFLPIYHIFTNRKKHFNEKVMMLNFAIIINVFSGASAGIHIFKYSLWILFVFPIINILNGAILLTLLFNYSVDEYHIAEDNSSTKQVFIGIITLSMVFILCHFLFKLYWAIVLSICVAYATNINEFIENNILRNLGNRIALIGLRKKDK